MVDLPKKNKPKESNSKTASKDRTYDRMRTHLSSAVSRHYCESPATPYFTL